MIINIFDYTLTEKILEVNGRLLLKTKRQEFDFKKAFLWCDSISQFPYRNHMPRYTSITPTHANQDMKHGQKRIMSSQGSST